MFVSSLLHCFHCVDARLYNWTTFGETLDWSHIVACSAIITPTTNFNVTVFLSSPGVRPYTHITSLTSLNIAEEANVSFPQAEGITVSLQILEEEAGKSSMVKILKCTSVCEPVVTLACRL